MVHTVNVCPIVHWQRPKIGYHGAPQGMHLGSRPVGKLVRRLV
jgi:hypothetical protein